MAIIYSYPAESSPQPGDLILGTSTATVDGKQTNVTRTYSMQTITDYIKTLGGIGVESITFSAPLTGGTITQTGTVSIPQASSVVDGYLSSGDWTTFNNKLGGVAGTPDSIPLFATSVSLGNSSIAEPAGGTTVTIGKALTPLTDATYDLGITGTQRWRNMFLSGTANAVDFTGTNLTITGTLSTNGSTGTNGYILQSKGAAAPQWVDLSSAYDTYDLNATTNGSDVDINLTSTSGTDNSVIKLVPGTDVALTRISGAEVKIELIPPYVGTIDEIDSSNTNILTISNKNGPTTTLNPVMGSVASANTGLVTGGDVNTAIQSALTGLVEFKGGFDGNTGKVAGTADFLDSRGTQIAAAVGDYYVVTVAGTFYTETVEIGDSLICQTATTSGTGSLSDWVTVQSNIGVATTTTQGIANYPTGIDQLNITAGAVTAKTYAGTSTSGYVPTSAGGDAGKFLRQDGTWQDGPASGVSDITFNTGLTGGTISAGGSTITVDYTSATNVILAAADGTSDTLADADDFIFSVGNNAKYGNLSQLKTYIGAGSGTVTGSGTTNTLPKFTSSTAIGDSNIADTGSLVTITGDAKVTGTLEFAATSDLLTPNTTPTAGNAGDVLKSLGAGNGWEWGTVTAGVSSVTFTQGGTIAAATNLNESLEITPTTGAVVVKAKKFAGVDTAGVITSTTGDASKFLKGDGTWDTIAAGGVTRGVETKTGDGTTTIFTGVTGALTVGSKNNIDIYISGVYQQKATYSYSSAASGTVTFTTAPPVTATDGIEFVTTV